MYLFLTFMIAIYVIYSTLKTYTLCCSRFFPYIVDWKKTSLEKAHKKLDRWEILYRGTIFFGGGQCALITRARTTTFLPLANAREFCFGLADHLEMTEKRRCLSLGRKRELDSKTVPWSTANSIFETGTVESFSKVVYRCTTPTWKQYLLSFFKTSYLSQGFRHTIKCICDKLPNLRIRISAGTI